MIDRLAVLTLGLLVLALYFSMLAVTHDWQPTIEQLQRLVKYIRVTYYQMQPKERQEYAMGAGMVIFFLWWSVAIVKGW
jgi:hypothetical protein